MSPKPEIRIHCIIESYKRILMKFYGEVGCGLETNDYILVTIRITIRIRESVIRIREKLAFGGGLCSFEYFYF